MKSNGRLSDELPKNMALSLSPTIMEQAEEVSTPLGSVQCWRHLIRRRDRIRPQLSVLNGVVTMKLHEAIGLELERREKCASRQHCEKAELQARIEALIVALEIIAGKRQCTDNTMSNVEIALAALLDSEPSAHTCNASCQRPACVLRRRVEGAVVTPPILRIEK